jgi:hypothetical protein
MEVRFEFEIGSTDIEAEPLGDSLYRLACATTYFH